MIDRQLSSIELVERDADFIKRWLVDTTTLIEQHVHPEGPPDMLCITAIAVSGNYCRAIFELLRLNHHMPVKALLRVLCELSSKLAWCLVTPKDRGKSKDSSVDKKILQWEKNSLFKKLNIMEEFRYIVPEEQRQQLEKSIEDTKRRIRQIHCSPMPRTIEIFYKLSKSWRAGVYTRGYLQFNDSVHIDLGTLASTISKQGDQININLDTAEDLTQLSGYCVSFMYQIIYLVRSNFGWDTNQLSDDLHTLSADHSPALQNGLQLTDYHRSIFGKPDEN